MEVICRDHNNAPVPKNTVQGRFFFHLFLKNSITLNLYILHLLLTFFSGKYIGNIVKHNLSFLSKNIGLS